MTWMTQQLLKFLKTQKQASLNLSQPARGPVVGDTLTFTMLVENTGNVDLTNLTVEDQLVGYHLRKFKSDNRTNFPGY